MLKKQRLTRGFAAFILLLATWVIPASAEITQQKLDQQLSGLSIAIDDVAKEIASLKEELLFPPVTRLQVYLSLGSDVLYDIHSLKLFIDGKEKNFHIYSERDITALRLGGIQQFYEGNVTLGEHKATVVFIGFDARKNRFTRKIDFTFEKQLEGHAIELAIVTGKDAKEPDFLVKDWGEK